MPESSDLIDVNTRQGRVFYLNLPKAVTGLHNTNLGESIYDIARAQCNSNNPEVIQNYAQKLIKLNTGVLRNMGIPPNKANIFRPMPFSTLVLPNGNTTEAKGMNNFNATQHAKIVNRLPFAHRQVLHRIINHPDIDIATFNSVAMVTTYMQHMIHSLREKERDIDANMLLEIGFAISERYSDALKDMAKELKESLADTEETLGTYLAASDINKKVARDAFLKAHHKLNRNFNKAINHLNALQFKVQNAGYYQNAKNLVGLRKAGKIVTLFDLEAFRAASKVCIITETAGFFMLAAESAEVAHDTYEAYKHHEDWAATLAEGLTLVGAGGFAGDLLASFLIIPELGSIALFVGVVTAGIGAYKFGKVIETRVEHFFKAHPK